MSKVTLFSTQQTNQFSLRTNNPTRIAYFSVEQEVTKLAEQLGCKWREDDDPPSPAEWYKHCCRFLEDNVGLEVEDPGYFSEPGQIKECGHNVGTHQVAFIKPPFEEWTYIREAYGAANQFIKDNYDPDMPAAYFAETASGEIIVPLRKDILGVLMVVFRDMQSPKKFMAFRKELMAVAFRNGIEVRL